MLREQIAAYVTPFGVAAVALAVIIISNIWTRISYSRKIQALGGVHAPKLADNPIGCKS